MKKRPLIQKGIAELEKLFDEQRDDTEFLTILIAELSERRVPRAQGLKQRALQAVGTAPKPVLSTTRAPSQAAKKPPRPTQHPPKETEREEKQSERIQQTPQTVRRTFATPPLQNKAEDILSTWTAMEVLSPPSFKRPEDLAGGDRYRIASINKDSLPWVNEGERSRPSQKLYYQVILGSVDMAAAVSALLQVYADSRSERPQARGDAVLATIMVDREGRPVATDPLGISSFGWGIPVALSGRLRDLGQWSQAETGLLEGLTAKLVVDDKDGNPRPLTKAAIDRAFMWLVQAIDIPKDFVRPPTFAVRSYQYFKLQDPPESILLNSFFLNDLAEARTLVTHGNAPSNLARYLGLVRPETRLNLMKDNTALSMALEPKKFPLGSWPAAERHPLVLLQQCAVNLAVHDLADEGMLAVNGPPGTGKTTLLRDVIAAIVTNRAEVMCSYDDPEQAFAHSGQKIKKGNAFIHLYRLDGKIRGHEIIVASSNNKAVENVSAELPGMEAIAKDAAGLRYFKTVSDALLQRDTWGTIAAVLGNAKNRSDFRQTFWWDDDFGLQRYLQQASGNPQLITEKTDAGTSQRQPHIIGQEDAPEDHTEAIRRWKKARQNFQKTLNDSKKAIADLQTAYELQIAIQNSREAIRYLTEEIKSVEPSLREKNTAAQFAVIDQQQKQWAVDSLERERDDRMLSRPGFFSRIFRTARYCAWEIIHKAAQGQLEAAHNELITLKREVEAKSNEHLRLKADYQKLEVALRNQTELVSREESRHRALASQYAGTFMSADFFELDHKLRQTTAPWLDKGSARLRNNVFEAAMALHKAFVDAAAKPIRHNLNVLLDGFGTRSLGTSEKDALIPHLWSTLFLVVPVVSTTFASVSRMFCKIAAKEFGWLLVDEAGQALPQAAVGALMRTQRAVVVGDPIQIEPVVVLPDQLTEAICLQFGIDPIQYNAPGASTQTLADSATAYYGTFETRVGTREVGVPLLVHRRCAEPMFGISNSIAYENLMVQAKAPKPSAIRDTLGPSRWIDVIGHGQDKWCQQEGEMVLDLLRQLREKGCMPDFYIVTPFVVVQDRMREILRKSSLLDGWVENPSAWIYERIGTVHTVQGREAEAVFFLLGAPNSEQRGARGWAGGRPNILNVATTRAKEAIYVIGNRSLWKTAGVFQALDEFLE